VVTVFAGADIESTERVRSYCLGHLPSSPAIAILRAGRLLYMLERHQIEKTDRRDNRAHPHGGVR
jgi:putative YphP/YqiW family bacilliredoxin